MFTGKIVRNILIPAAAVVTEKSTEKPQPTTDCNRCKPSELPIYSYEEHLAINKAAAQREPPEPGRLEQAFSKVRQSVFAAVGELKQIQVIGEQYLSTGMQKTESIISYLREEDNTTPKYGAIAVGGLAGLILGLRGRFFRRTIYASTGALGMAALCYPKEASEYSQIAIQEAKRYATIGYNFVHGVKKDDPPLALPSLPPMPTSLSEAWDVAKNLGKSTKSSVAGSSSTSSTNLDEDDDEDQAKRKTQQNQKIPAKVEK